MLNGECNSFQSTVKTFNKSRPDQPTFTKHQVCIASATNANVWANKGINKPECGEKQSHVQTCQKNAGKQKKLSKHAEEGKNNKAV